MAALIAVEADWTAFRRSLDTAIAVGDWSAARQLTRSARTARPAPAWLGEHEPDLIWSDLQVAQAFKERSMVQVGVGRYVNGTLKRSNDIVDLARQWHAAGDRESALILVKEVLETSPTHRLAQRLLIELQMPATAPTP